MPLIIQNGSTLLCTKLKKVLSNVGVFEKEAIYASTHSFDSLEEHNYSRQNVLKRILSNPGFVKRLVIDIEWIKKPFDIPVLIYTSENDVFVLGYIENKFIHEPNFEMYYSELLQKYPFLITGWKVTGGQEKYFGLNLTIKIYA